MFASNWTHRSYDLMVESDHYRGCEVRNGVLADSSQKVHALILPIHTWNEEQQETFMSEAKALCSIQNPAITPLIDAGFDEKKQPVLIYKGQCGVSISKALTRHNSGLPATSVLNIAKHAAGGLHALHKAGAFHGHLTADSIHFSSANDCKLSFLLPPSAITAVTLISSELEDAKILDIYTFVASLMACLQPDYLKEWSKPTTPPLIGKRTVSLDKPLGLFFLCGLNGNIHNRYTLIDELSEDIAAIQLGEQPAHALSILQRAASNAKKHSGVSASDADKIKKHLASKQESGIHIDKNALQTLAKLVVIEDCGMEASIRLAPDSRFSRDMLLLVIKAADVNYGLLDTAIAEATRPDGKVRKICIARGTPAYPGKPGTTVTGETIEPSDNPFDLTIDDDKLHAWLHSDPRTAVSRDAIQEFLEDQDVFGGVLDEAIEQLCTSEQHESTVLIAKGSAPQQSIPGHFVFSRNELLPADFEETAESRFENVPPNVHAGDCIAVWRKTQHGIPGRSISGETIPPDPIAETEPPVFAGVNTAMTTNKNGESILRATINGTVQKLEDDTIRVVPTHSFTGNRTAQHDPIDTNDIFVVNGSVENGATIIAAGGIIITGDLGDANIQTGGDLHVHGAILPGEHQIQVAGTTTASSISERSLVTGKLHISGIILSSNIVAVHTIEATTIVGGSTVTGGNITCATAGDDSEAETLLWAGHNIPAAIKHELVVHEERKLRTEREHMIIEKDHLRADIDTMSKKQYRFQVGGYMRDDYLRVLQDQAKRIRIRSETIDQSLDHARESIVHKVEESHNLLDETDNILAQIITKTCHTGVTVRIAGTEPLGITEIRKDFRYVLKQ